MSSDLADLVRRSPAVGVILALEQVTTVAGAQRIYHAELAGRRRSRVLRSADRRIAQLRGTEDLSHRTRLVVAATVVETDALRRGR